MRIAGCRSTARLLSMCPKVEALPLLVRDRTTARLRRRRGGITIETLLGVVFLTLLLLLIPAGIRWLRPLLMTILLVLIRLL